MKKGSCSLEEWCKKMNKKELLSLYDQQANSCPPSEVPFSSGKNYKFRCPVCGMSWTQKPNKVNRIKAHNYNVIKQRKEITYCPYCSGKRPSPYYNLSTAIPEAKDWWDSERNSTTMDSVLPSSHQTFFLRCPKCDYQLPKSVRIEDRGRVFLCPICGGGKNTVVTDMNCLSNTYPQIANELDNARNNGITGKMILPSFNKKLWFICPNGHRYQAKVSNRTYLNRGCPTCDRRNKTSFPEQAFRFYIQKCTSDIQSDQIDSYTKQSIDILLPTQKTAIEFNSSYYHTDINKGQRISSDLNKIYTLTQYYRVYIIVEEGTEYSLCSHPLIQIISVPIFSLTEEVCRRYDNVILELLKSIFPNLDSYPNINIMRDQLSILQQYIRVPIKNSFEAKYPLLARDWHPTLNGHLTPSMFPPTAQYKFYWVCRKCGNPYQMNMSNRTKVNPDTCRFCHHKSRYKSPLLSKTYPFLKSFWCEPLNNKPFSQISVASGKFGVFELFDGRIVPVQICKLSEWLYKHPDRTAEEYLNRCWKKFHNQGLKTIN